jgi:hypothetical protein
MMVSDNLPILRCPSCGNMMKLLRTVPRLDQRGPDPQGGGLPDLLVFLCPSCNEIETKEDNKAAA